MTGFVSPDPLNNLTNLYQRPEFIQADRTPTINDVKPAGTQWGDNVAPVQNIYETPGRGIWFLLGSAGGPLNTINLVAPVANNIDLINEGGAGAVAVAAPGSGGAGTIGLSVNVDGVTIQIIGNQLVAVGASRQDGVDTFTFPGTDPVLPTGAGLITVTGAQVAAGVVGANVIRTDSLAANSYTIEIQRSAAVAVTNSTNNGVSHFDSSMFTVDANGFVQLAGGGLAIDQIAVQATTAPGVTPVVPTAGGLVTINGTAVAQQAIPLQSRSIAVNSLQLEVQRAATSTGTNATSQGVASFDDTQFTADASGYVQLLGVSSGTAQTVGAVTADVITFPMGAVAGTRAFDVTVAGFEATGPSGVGYSIIASVRTTGVAGTLIPTPDITNNEDAALAAASGTVVVVGNDAIVRVTGVAGLTIEWSATLQSVFAS